MTNMPTRKKAPVRRQAVKESSTARLARLLESEMDKAEIVLNAKAIVNKLQKMAEDLAKIEADDLMPVTDMMRSAFGPEMTDRFNQAVTQHVRSTTETIKQAKDAIGNEVSKLEGSVNGEMPNDMAMSGQDAAPPADPMAADPMAGDAAPEADLGLDDAMGEGDPLGDDADLGELPPDGEGDLGLEGDAQNAAGRTRKESARPRSRMIEGRTARRMLRESHAPDGLVFTVFRRKLVEKRDAQLAATITARLFGIDRSDVIGIVRESHAVETPWQHLEDQGYTVTCDGPGVYYWHMRRKDGKPYYEDNQDGTSSSREAAWADLESELASRAGSDAVAPVGGSVGMDVTPDVAPMDDMGMDDMGMSDMGMDDMGMDAAPMTPPPPVVPPAPVPTGPLPSKPPMSPLPASAPMGPMVGEAKKPAFGGKQAAPFGKKADGKDDKKSDSKKSENPFAKKDDKKDGGKKSENPFAKKDDKKDAPKKGENPFAKKDDKKDVKEGIRRPAAAVRR